MPAIEQPNGREVFVVMNADSGRGKDDGPTPDDVRAAFADRGAEIGMATLHSGDDLTQIVGDAASAGWKVVVAAGGDGTICGVTEALIGTDTVLGVLPLGTFNFFARSLSIPEELEAAVDVILTGTPEPASLGEVNGRVFINNASLGAYPAILEERESVYRFWGRSRLAAYWSVLKSMLTLYRPLTMRIVIDGEPYRAKSPMVFVGVRAYQLDRFEIEGADDIRDGRFAILLAPDSGRFALIWTALRVAMRGLREGRDFELLTGREVVVETRQDNRRVARDGEHERMAQPYRFRFLEDAVRVMAPGRAAIAAPVDEPAPATATTIPAQGLPAE